MTNNFNSKDIFSDIMLSPMELELQTESENVKLPSPELMEYYRLRGQRVFNLYDDITEDTVFPIIDNILRCNDEDRNIPVESRVPIILRLTSAGGDPSAAMSLVAVIQLSKTPVINVNMSVCYSAAFLILIAAQKRYGLPFSAALWHPGNANLSGGLTAVTDTMDFIKKLEKTYEDYIIAHTKMDKKTYAKIKKNDFFMTTAESLTYGVIDEVIEDINILYN